MRDYQVIGLTSEKLDAGIDGVDGDTFLSGMKIPYQIAHLLFLLLVAGLPFVLLHLPVGFFATIYSDARRKKALARSKVKIRALDVSVLLLGSIIFFCFSESHA